MMTTQTFTRKHHPTMRAAVAAIRQNEQANAVCTSPVDTLAPANSFAPELEDAIEWIEKDDYVRVERLVRRADDTATHYGVVVQVNAQTQYALVELEVSKWCAWFHIDEVFLVLKAGALAPACAKTNAR